MVLIINKHLENDYELLYLIDNNNEEALTFLMEKYDNLIYKMINKYKFPKNEFDDLFQEAKLVLFKAIKTFDESYKKTFTNYYKLLLENRFNTLIKAYNKLEYYETTLNLDLVVEEENSFDEIDILKMLSSVEKAVYFKYFLGQVSISELVESLNLTKKQAYNAISRIKQKLHKQKNKLINKIN